MSLAAWAEHLAAELHARYGDYVAITVGAFRYPGRDEDRRLLPTLPDVPAAALGLTVSPVEPLSVNSGDSTMADLRVDNESRVARELHTIGHLTTYVVDGQQQVMGGHVGAVHVPLVRFRIEPASTSRVPALLGTASMRPEIGYAVPRGLWHVVVELPTTDGHVLSSAMPLIIT